MSESTQNPIESEVTASAEPENKDVGVTGRAFIIKLIVIKLLLIGVVAVSVYVMF